jgi:hypothetical protein
MAGSIDNIKNSFKNNWKAILWGLIPIVIIVIIFALPLKIVPVQTTEKYMDTEMQQQPYTEQETYQDTEPYQTTETQTRTIYNSYVNSGWSYSFNVADPNTTVNISLSGGTNYRPYYYQSYQPYYFNPSDNMTPYHNYPYYQYGYNWWGNSYYPSQDKVTIQISYPQEVTKYRTVTKTRDVVKYREVPVQVEKERTATKYVQMSIWQYLFFDQSQKAGLPAVQTGG